ncbi:hypothetical protein CPB83DRAFT_830392 [Crepidotus variabilis]|uniref:Uncharacterized protein n=1 Tax=Crepidotus variabilis TaxID=179855 RepID=A0A9P6JVF0_9AGAR|nr:hypothetical protein CPB83DRAFT_830392 [Crepidotus variabilis]
MLGIENTEAVASFMQTCFKSYRLQKEVQGGIKDFPEHPRKVQLYVECIHAVKILVKAFENKNPVSWSVVEYAGKLSSKCTGQNETVEAKLLQNYPPPSPSYHATPGIFVNNSGVIILWYLPNILFKSRAAKIWDSLTELEPLVKVNRASSSWRAGNVSLAPAWYQQAHEKSSRPEVSQSIRRPEAERWMECMAESFLIIGGIMFKMGCQGLRRLGDSADGVKYGDALQDILRLWATPFNVISAIYKEPSHSQVLE